MPLRNAQLDEHRSRIGMVMPDVGDTKLYQKVVGGIKIGYSGHVPRAQSHAFTSSMGGVAAAEESGYNYTAQRGHVVWQEKSVGRGEKMATLRAAHSIPGYHGHRRGAEEVGGTSFWHNDPSAAARARPKRESPKPRRETRVDASTDYEKEARAAAAAAHAAGCRMAWASSAGLPPQPVAQEMPTQDSERKAYQAAVDRGRRNAVVETMPAAPQPTHAAGKPTRKAWPAPAAAAPGCPRGGRVCLTVSAPVDRGAGPHGHWDHVCRPPGGQHICSPCCSLHGVWRWGCSFHGRCRRWRRWISTPRGLTRLPLRRSNRRWHSRVGECLARWLLAAGAHLGADSGNRPKVVRNFGGCTRGA